MPAARVLSRFYFRARVVGAEYLPRERPVIYVGKHPRSYLYLETVLLGLHAFWTTDRPAFRVLEETGTSLHSAPLLGWIRRHVQSLPATASEAYRTLKRGESLLIFPGGTRELYGPPDRLQWDGRQGFARMAMHMAVPVVPFAIRGADGQHPWRLAIGRRSIWLPPIPLPVRLEFVFGEPLMPRMGAPGERKRATDEFADRVEAATQALLVRPPARSAHAGRIRNVTSARSDRPDVPAPPDPQQWRFRYGIAPAARALCRYHRLRLQGERPHGPCIYVTHHGAGYFNLDLALAVYRLAWHRWFEGERPFLPLRIVAAQGHGLERALPGLAQVKRTVGLIGPSERTCLAALERGEQLLITPGGRREANPRARDYRLRWKERYGFVRLALQTGVPIVPLAVVGGYTAYPGISHGRWTLWSPLPLPARLDVAIGRPLSVQRRPIDASNAAIVKSLQQEIWEATQTLYDRLLASRRRAADTDE